MGRKARDILDDLVDLSSHLGDPAHDYVILGEGNTSALEGDGSFWVKASGTQMRAGKRQSFVRVSLARALAMLESPDMDDDAVLRALVAAKVDRKPEPLPSVETVVHAVCLATPGVKFVGHTHPTPVNAITCSAKFDTLLRGRMFPDEVVVCGPEALAVPYADPGLRLAVEVRRALQKYAAAHGAAPKTVYLQNHGLISLGATPREVENITAMATKAARILLGAMSTGGVNYLSPQHVQRIHNRVDEHYRQRIIGNGS